MKVPEVAKRIRLLRETLKLSQAQLAVKLGISQATESWLESGKATPDHCMCLELAKWASGEDRKYFLGRVGSRLPSLLALAEQLLKERGQVAAPGATIQVRRVRVDGQKWVDVEPPVAMPSRGVPDWPSIVCFVLEKEELVVDTAEPEPSNPAAFYGQVVLAEFSPHEKLDVGLGWTKGLQVGALYLGEETSRLGKRGLSALFLRLSGEAVSSTPVTVGLFEEKEPGILGGEVVPAASGPIATWEDFKNDFIRRHEGRFPKVANETEREWLLRVGPIIEKESMVSLLTPEFGAEMARIHADSMRRSEVMAREMFFHPGFKVIGRVIAVFPISGETRSRARSE